mgnify:CR=1 FL=1
MPANVVDNDTCLLAARAKKAGIAEVVFDRGGNKYAGRVAAIADGAREGGLVL